MTPKMENYYIQIIVTVLLFVIECNSLDSSCDAMSSQSRLLGVSMSTEMKELGKWTDTILANADHSVRHSNISVNVVHNVTECRGRRHIQIQAIIQNGNIIHPSRGSAEEILVPIKFDNRHGSNVLLSNNGRTIEKIDPALDNNGVAFTDRALKNEELFEVRLEKKGLRTSYSFGIGILTKNPKEVEILPHIHFSEYAWMYHNDAIYNRNSEKRSNYGKNLNSLPVGTRFGVMKKASGDIHFFVDGADQGSAISGMSDPIYGIVELWHNAEKVTIISP